MLFAMPTALLTKLYRLMVPVILSAVEGSPLQRIKGGDASTTLPLYLNIIIKEVLSEANDEMIQSDGNCH